MKAFRLAPAVLVLGVMTLTSLTAPSLPAAPKAKAPPAITIQFEGASFFYAYAKMEHLLIVDPAGMNLLCRAELTTTDGRNFVLHTIEGWPDDEAPGGFFVYRETSFTGTMTPSGQLKFTWPETWLEVNWDTGNLEPTPYPNVVAQIEEHTGYDLRGRGVNKDTVVFSGSFDGEALVAGFQVNALQVKPGTMEPYNVVVPGPIEFSIWFELAVAE